MNILAKPDFMCDEEELAEKALELVKRGKDPLDLNKRHREALRKRTKKRAIAWTQMRLPIDS